MMSSDDEDYKIPVRTEITVLPADLPNQPLLGWTLKERLGSPIGHALGPKGRPLPIRVEKDLLPGDTILVPGIEGIHTMVVRDTGEEPYRFIAYFTEEGGSTALLSFGDDASDPCWCVVAWVTGRGTTQMTLEDR